MDIRDMELEFLQQYWQQVMGLLALVVVSVKLAASVRELRKDVDDIVKQRELRDTYVETTKLRAEMNMMEKQVSALWNQANKLRDMVNGGSRK
jgi:hypothetical protein